MSNSMLSKLIELGPSQPKSWDLPLKIFPKTQDLEKKFRFFHEMHYNRLIQNGMMTRRIWLSYSLDRVFCISCKLFGLNKAKKLTLAEHGTKDWKNIKEFRTS